MREVRAQLAETLQDQLGQQLAGTLLAAGALCAHLARRRAAEATEAAYLLDMLKNANRELNCLIANLDGDKLR
jgi:signal transduction histidine kinase